MQLLNARRQSVFNDDVQNAEKEYRAEHKEAAMKKLIFLDFDGVLHPNFSTRSEYFSQAGYLLDALDGHSENVEIIISSSWRFHWSTNAIMQMLPKTLASMVTGITPVGEPGRHQRYREIQAYLRSRIGPHEWRALDDAVNEFPKNCTELIECDGRIGLDDLSAARLRGWLNAR
jgi:hypothetical protein